ncbi:MAG: T9SS type A sorting domain-containing protein [Candidatus Electryonea clarkiae]|nr:T9SS type A sorting domain-containing protein [Candidatus Electryonea clarkiae]MDP8285122.1 T9SS type A sorting domain-containing protein [Candidatus Electryonea clarkiae]
MTKKIFLIALMGLFLAAPMFAGVMVQNIAARDWRIIPIAQGELDEDLTLYEFDFEEGEDWTSVDQTAVGTAWHTSDFGAYDDGTSWWCGDEDIEGYNNHWLQYLESPELDLTNAVGADLALTFMMYLDCEGTGEEPAGYDGWDGANAWYSTDGGDEWSVLEDPDPEYGSESLYSFGSEFGMGPGIAGWNGNMDHEWMDVEFSLEDFAGEASFMVRFAFSADPGSATPDEGYLSFFIDDILISDDVTDYLENNAEDIAEPDDLTPIEQIGSGNTWELQTDEYHSESHAWRMSVQNDLLCGIISPEIDIPPLDEWPATYMSYWVYCDMLDNDGDGDGSLDDLYEIHASTNGVEWTRIVYDYGYNGSELGWIERTSGLLDGGNLTDKIDLSDYAGETIQIRITGKTDGDDDGGVGEGLFIDDITIFSTTGFEYDIGVEPLYIPFPATVNYPVPATVTFANKGNNQQVFNAYWQFSGGNPAGFQDIDLEPGESIVFPMDPDPNDETDSWIPTDAEQVTFYARQLADPDDNDVNNSSNTYIVDVQPDGHYEIGYDDRTIPRYTSRLEVGEGPMMHFDIPEDLVEFDMDSIKIMWNGDLTEDVDVIAHVYDGGDAPGDEIYTETFTVTSTDVYTNWHIMDVSGDEGLLDMSGDYWVWIELTQTIDDEAFPRVVISPRLWGEGHCYDYDGTELVDADADWAFRVIGNATYTGNDVEQSSNPATPEKFSLGAAYPNPFNPTTTIRVNVAHTATIHLIAYNLMGQEVAKIVDREMTAGSYNMDWDADGLAAGMYFIHMETDGFSAVQKVMLLK